MGDRYAMSTLRRFAEQSPSSTSSTSTGESGLTRSTSTVNLSAQSQDRNVILFLAANPMGMGRLKFEEECAAIENEIRMTAGRDDFEFRSKWAVTVDQMMRHLNELRPAIIHFSGHGWNGTAEMASGSSRVTMPTGIHGSCGLYMQSEDGSPHVVSARALRMMIKATTASTRVIVLNACYSSLQAKTLRTVVDCVVGMNGAIDDDAARAFAVGFYRALGNRRSIGNAVEQAVAILAAKQLPDEHLPCCRTRRGIDASQIFLTRAAATP